MTFDLAGHTWQMTNNLAFANTGTARFSGGRLRVGYDNQINTTSTVTVWASQRLVLTNNATDFMGNLNTETGGAIEALGNDTIVSWAVNLKAAPAGAPSLRLTTGSFFLTNALEASRLTFNDGAKVSLEGGAFSVRYITDTYGTRANPSVLDIYTNAPFIARAGLNVCRTGAGLSIVNVLGGTGVVTGSVVFATGSIYGRDITSGAGPLQVTAGAVFQSGVTVRLDGYTVQDLAAGIPLVVASTGGVQVAGRMPVTLDGMSHPYWWTQLSADGKTLTARVIPLGTMFKVF